MSVDQTKYPDPALAGSGPAYSQTDTLLINEAPNQGSGTITLGESSWGVLSVSDSFYGTTPITLAWRDGATHAPLFEQFQIDGSDGGDSISFVRGTGAIDFDDANSPTPPGSATNPDPASYNLLNRDGFVSVINGGPGGNTIGGTPGRDQIFGGKGENVISGYGGDDHVTQAATANDKTQSDLRGAITAALTDALTNAGVVGQVTAGINASGDLTLATSQASLAVADTFLTENSNPGIVQGDAQQGASAVNLDVRVLSGAGLDTVVGGVGNDTISGGGGHDLFVGDGGDNTLIAGTDVVQNGASVSVVGGTGNDTLFGHGYVDLTNQKSAAPPMPPIETLPASGADSSAFYDPASAFPPMPGTDPAAWIYQNIFATSPLPAAVSGVTRPAPAAPAPYPASPPTEDQATAVLPAPSNLRATASASGGALAAGTYNYVVTATNANGAGETPRRLRRLWLGDRSRYDRPSCWY